MPSHGDIKTKYKVLDSKGAKALRNEVNDIQNSTLGEYIDAIIGYGTAFAGFVVPAVGVVNILYGTRASDYADYLEELEDFYTMIIEMTSAGYGETPQWEGATVGQKFKFVENGSKSGWVSYGNPFVDEVIGGE